MRKKIGLFTLGFLCVVPSVSALSDNVVGSWATFNSGEVMVEVDKGYENRVVLNNSLYEADASGLNNKEEGFTGIGYFGEKGVIYTFDNYDDEGNKTHNSRLVKNPNRDEADLKLREVTWDGDRSTWTAEAVKVYAVNYNGTGEDKLIAYAYNKVAYKRAEAKSEVLPQVEGADVKFVATTDNLYDTLITFGDDFKYCDAIRLVDYTEELKYLGGNGQNVHDGYDLDAIYGYKILYSPVGDVTYKDETAISIGDLNINCSDSWQKVVMKVKVSDLKEQDKFFDIIAGQFYKIGTGRIYLEDGIVKVDYEFSSYYDIKGIDTAKVGIYRDINSMMKDGKLLGNGKLVNDDMITLDDEYAYIRLHFDVSIPEYLYDSLEKIENIETVCEKEEIKDNDKETCNKECSDKKHDKDHDNKKDKEYKNPCNKIVDKVKKDCHKVVKDCSKKLYKTCNKIKVSFCKLFFH